MITTIQLDKTEEICKWMLSFSLKNSLEAVQTRDLGRAEAFLRMAIALIEILEELKL